MLLLCGSVLKGGEEVTVSSTPPYITWCYSRYPGAEGVLDSRVVGYNIYYGTMLGNTTNVFDAHNTNLVDLAPLVPGFKLGKTNWIFVTAYDSLRNESSPSTVLYCYLYGTKALPMKNNRFTNEVNK